MCYYGNETGVFVTWGWMEDNIINRYVSFEAGDDRLPKLTMRSIDTILDEKGLPISTEDLGEDAFKKIQGRWTTTKIRY